MGKSLFTGRIPVQSEVFGATSFKVDIVNNTKRLDLRLIDTTNIFNIYICTITPGDFSVTKREQGIKVDFEKFIRILIQFFMDLNEGTMTGYFSPIDNDSNRGDNRDLKKDYGSADDRNIINESIYKFVFVENNTFRNITRLELLFYKPDDREFKKYLSDIITRFEEDNVKLIRESISLKETLNQREEEIKRINRELNSEIRDIKEKADKLYKENCILEDENSRKDTEIEKLERKINENTKKYNDLDYQFEKMKVSDIKNSTALKEMEDLKKTIAKNEQEIVEKNKGYRELKDELKKVKRALDEKEEMENEYKEDIESLKKEIHEKNKKKDIYLKQIEELKSSFSEKENKIRNLEKENRELNKKLENAQQVYNHFYKKKVELKDQEKSEDTSLFSSFHPESPPPK